MCSNCAFWLLSVYRWCLWLERSVVGLDVTHTQQATGVTFLDQDGVSKSGNGAMVSLGSRNIVAIKTPNSLKSLLIVDKNLLYFGIKNNIVDEKKIIIIKKSLKSNVSVLFLIRKNKCYTIDSD